MNIPLRKYSHSIRNCTHFGFEYCAHKQVPKSQFDARMHSCCTPFLLNKYIILCKVYMTKCLFKDFSGIESNQLKKWFDFLGKSQVGFRRSVHSNRTNFNLIDHHRKSTLFSNDVLKSNDGNQQNASELVKAIEMKAFEAFCISMIQMASQPF